MSRRKSSEAENPFWITYSDLLSSLFMVTLVLLFAFQGLSMIQSQQLREKAKELENKTRELEKKTEELEKDQEALDKDAENFQSLLTDLKKLQKEFKDQKVEIDENGNLRIPDTILFKSGKSKVLPKGKQFLEKFIPKYAAVVTKPEYHDIIEGVVFEGHADTEGDKNDSKNYFDNMFITTERAYNVNQFVLTEIPSLDEKTKAALRRLSTVAGRSNIEARLALKPEQIPTKHNLKSPEFRRVEVKLLLKNPIYKWGKEAR